MTKTLQIPDFPDIIPILPLQGVILMPRTLLPLPIFEAPHAAMVAACIQTNQKYIGLVQPISAIFESQILAPLFSTGCLGEIVDFGKTEDHNLVVLISLRNCPQKTDAARHGYLMPHIQET